MWRNVTLSMSPWQRLMVSLCCGLLGTLFASSLSLAQSDHGSGDHDSGAHAEVSVDADLSHDGHGADGHGADSHGEHGDGGHAAAGSTNPITLDPDLPIVTGIIFLILLAVLWKFAWGPIVEALDSREKTLADQLAEAKANHEKSQQLLAEHESRIAGATAEVKQLLDDARKDADSQKQQILESAQAAASAEKDRAVREIDAAKNAALQEMAKNSVDTAVSLAGRIVQRQLNDEDHSNLINDAMRQFNEN